MFLIPVGISEQKFSESKSEGATELQPTLNIGFSTTAGTYKSESDKNRIHGRYFCCKHCPLDGASDDDISIFS
jgi:hypothetical protein